MRTRINQLLYSAIAAVFTICLLMPHAMNTYADSVTVDSAESLARALYAREPVICADADKIDTYLTEALTAYPVLGFDFNGYKGEIRRDTITMEMAYRGTETLPVLYADTPEELMEVVTQAAVYCLEEVHILLPDSMRDLDYAALFEEAFADSVLARTMLSSRSWEIWVNGYTDALYMSLQLAYEVDAAQLRRYKQQTEQAAMQLAQTLFYRDAEDAVTALLAHDAIVNRCIYDNSRFDEVENHSAYGVLVNGHAVCEGYAEAFQLLMEIADVECLYIEGTADGERHGWNMIAVDSEYYHVDATWDDPVAEDGAQYLQHNYFLVSDDIIDDTHFWEQSRYPQASGNLWNAQRARDALSLQTETGAFSLDYAPLCSDAAFERYEESLNDLLTKQMPDVSQTEPGTQITDETTQSAKTTETTSDTTETRQNPHTDHTSIENDSQSTSKDNTTDTSTTIQNNNDGTAPAAIYVVWGILIVLVLGILYAKYLH